MKDQIKGQMTLGELMAKLPKVDGGRVPGRRQVSAGSQVVCAYEDGDYKITVYDNGYALGEDGVRCVVFPVEECGAYYYGSVSDEGEYEGGTIVDACTFKNLPWIHRLLMETCDRFESNVYDEFSQWLRNLRKSQTIPRGLEWMLRTEESPEAKVLRDCEEAEMMNSLLKRQKEAVRLRLDGHSLAEIADIQNVTVQTVKIRLNAAMRRMQAAMEKVEAACR